MIENWVDFSISVLGGTTAFLCLYEGTRRLATYGVHRKAMLMTVLAVAVCGLYGAFAYWKYLDLSARLGASHRKPASLQLPADWGRGFSPERKSSLSLARARRGFVEFGTLEEYLDSNGETRSFSPAQEDLKRRERLVAENAQMDFAARGSLAEALLWLIAAVVAIAFGLAVSLERTPGKAGTGSDEEPQSGDAGGSQ